MTTTFVNNTAFTITLTFKSNGVAIFTTTLLPGNSSMTTAILNHVGITLVAAAIGVPAITVVNNGPLSFTPGNTFAINFSNTVGFSITDISGAVVINFALGAPTPITPVVPIVSCVSFCQPVSCVSFCKPTFELTCHLKSRRCYR